MTSSSYIQRLDSLTPFCSSHLVFNGSFCQTPSTSTLLQPCMSFHSTAGPSGGAHSPAVRSGTPVQSQPAAPQPQQTQQQEQKPSLTGVRIKQRKRQVQASAKFEPESKSCNWFPSTSCLSLCIDCTSHDSFPRRPPRSSQLPSPVAVR